MKRRLKTLLVVTIVMFTMLVSGCVQIGDLTLEKVADGLSWPLYVTSPPGDAYRLFIVEQDGTVRIAVNGTVFNTPFLDIRDKVNSSGLERGLLGFAFHPRYPENGRFYVNYTADGAGGTVFTIIEEYRVSLNPLMADPTSGKVILTFQQPDAIHNGGMLAFGLDGYLYISTGDGGPGNDPNNRAQSLDTLLGKILRIDVDSENPYGIPEDNPFVGIEGVRPEIWSFGFRNPWRFSFDRETGDRYIGDVGERSREEINYEPFDSPGGLNFGWRIREGSICRPGETQCELENAVDPIYEYDKLLTASVTGGYVYRGSAIPGLRGYYLFGDFSTGQVWAFRFVGNTVVDFHERTDLRPPVILPTISSFGEDANGELYIVSWLSGSVYKIVPSATSEE